jgi:hypothetical protein
MQRNTKARQFRDLLVALNFEATYDPRKRELTIRVTLVPELTHPDGPRAPLLLVPPAGTERKGRTRASHSVKLGAIYSLT